MKTLERTKTCVGCAEALPLDAFGGQRTFVAFVDLSGAIDVDAPSATLCRVCERKQYGAQASRTWRKRHPEQYADNLAKTKIWAQKPENITRRKLWRAAYFQKPENIARQKLRLAAYRALKRQATIVPFTADQLAARLSMFDGCWMCGAVATTIDHVKPLSKGGAHALCNLRPACLSCNSSKGATWPLKLVAA